MRAAAEVLQVFRDAAGRTGGKLLAFSARCEENERVRGAVFMALLVFIGGMMLLLNIHTPLMMDDYDYSFSWATGERLSGFADVLASQAAHYRIWGGRSVVHMLAQLFLCWGKDVFNAANALMYLVLLLEIYALAAPQGRRFCYPVLLAAHLALFFLVPFFGTAFLWLDGACNYLWGTVLALVPLLLQRHALNHGGMILRSKAAGWLLLPVCFLAGWTNENTACAVFAAVFLMLLLSAMEGKCIRGWQWAALVMQLLGIAVMLLAPGNFARASEVTGRSLVMEMVYRLAVVTVYALAYTAGLLAVMLLLRGLLCALGVRARTGKAMLLLLTAVLCAYALCASPLISDRSFTGVFVLALAATCVLLGDLDGQVRAWDGFKLPAAAMLAFVMAFGGYSALSDVKAHCSAWDAQLARVETAIEQGEPVQIESVLSDSPYTMDIRIESDPHAWPNSTLSRYFGVDIIGR